MMFNRFDITYRDVTSGQTDRRTPGHIIYAAIALRDPQVVNESQH